jgi:hypothetical protein
MAAANPARRGGNPGIAALLAALLALGVGCATVKHPDATALPPVSEIPPSEETPKPRSEDLPAAPKPTTVVVIDDGGAQAEAAPKTLAEAAEAERERRASAPKPVVVLDNKNLAAYGKDQKLTVANSSTSQSGTATAATEAAEAAQRDEAYWRDRGFEIRKRWREAADQVEVLQAKAEGLRRRFYSADDPYIRDGQIKPEWDKTLEELDKQRHAAEQGASEVEAFMNAGREAGALPGWLRAGVDLEPVQKPLKAPSAEPMEPVEATEPPSDPR